MIILIVLNFDEIEKLQSQKPMNLESVNNELGLLQFLTYHMLYGCSYKSSWDNFMNNNSDNNMNRN